MQFAKGLWEAVFHLYVAKTLSGILQKHVHADKQAGGSVQSELCGKVSLEVGVHNDSNEDD